MLYVESQYSCFGYLPRRNPCQLKVLNTKVSRRKLWHASATAYDPCAHPFSLLPGFAPHKHASCIVERHYGSFECLPQHRPHVNEPNPATRFPVASCGRRMSQYLTRMCTPFFSAAWFCSLGTAWVLNLLLNFDYGFLCAFGVKPSIIIDKPHKYFSPSSLRAAACTCPLVIACQGLLHRWMPSVSLSSNYISWCACRDGTQTNPGIQSKQFPSRLGPDDDSSMPQYLSPSCTCMPCIACPWSLLTSKDAKCLLPRSAPRN